MDNTHDSFSDLYEEFSEELLNSELGFDTSRTRAEVFPQALDSPLLDLLLRKINVLLTGKKDKNIKSNASFGREITLVEDMAQAYPGRIPTPYSGRFLVEILTRVTAGDWGRLTPPKKLEQKLYHPLMNHLGAMCGSKQPVKNIEFSQLTKKYFAAYNSLRRVYNKLRSHATTTEHPIVHTKLSNNDTLSLRKEGFCWAPNNTTTVVYGSVDMFLVIHDAVRLRYGSFLSRDVLLPAVRPEKILESFSWQESCIKRYGNDGYEILKNTEALSKAALSQKSGGGFKHFNVLDNMVEKIKKKELILNNTITVSCAERYRDILSTCTTEELVVLFALQKCTGHPIIDPKVGGRKARESGQDADNSYKYRVLESARRFKHELLVSYLSRNQGWPPMSFEEDNSLARLHRKQLTHITLGDYNLEDWDTSRILKIVNFDYYCDVTELLDDKSCAPTRSKMKQFYNKSLTDRTFRRLLSMFITQKVDMEALIHQFARNELPKDYYNIMLYPKEKEFKIAARMFCMLTYWIRLVLAVIQENVKKKIFPMFPQQSMTMSRNELTRSLLKMTAGGRPLFIEVDFSSWNLKFRDLLMNYYGEALDDLFGMKGVFGKSNWVFSESQVTVFVNDYRVPQLEGDENDGDMSWRNHEGGFEGIDQATWSLATIIMMSIAMDPFELPWKILMQGDNVTLTITIPDELTEDEEEDLALNISKSIEGVSKELNHEAKPEEFVISKTLYTYGKQILMCDRTGKTAENGHLVQNPIKYTHSVFPSTNEEIPNEADALGGIFSACAGAATVTHDPLSLWRLALIWFEDTVELFKSGGGWSGHKDTWAQLTFQEIILMAITPSVCGGLPIMTWNAFISKHEPCPLVSAIASLKYLKRAGIIGAGRVLTGLLNPTLYDDIPDPSRLLDDPFSIPLRSCESHLTTIRKRVEEYISRTATNPDVLGLTSVRLSSQDKSLQEALLATSPFYPAMAADAYKLSVVGKAREVIGMFTLTRTFVADAKDKGTYMKNLFTLMDQQLYYIVLRMRVFLQSNSSSYPRILSHNFAKRLRKFWKLKNEIEGLEGIHPLDYPVQIGGTSEPPPSGVSCHTISPWSKMITSTSRLKPFLGGKTRERRVGKGYEIRRSRGTEEISRLAVIMTSGLSAPTTQRLWQEILESRVGVGYTDILDIFPTVIGGTVAHRYEQLGVDGRIGPAGTPNILTHMLFDTDSVAGVSATATDYPVAFQLFFSYLAGYCRYISLGSPYHPEARSVRILFDATCMDALDDSPIELTGTVKIPSLPRLVGNPLVDIPTIEIIGQDIGWTPENLIRVDPPSHHAEHQKLLWVSSLLVQSIEGIKILDADLDESGFDTLSSVPSIDAVEFDTIGGDLMERAMVRAILNVSIPQFMTKGGRPRNRPELFGLIERYSRVGAAMLSPHLWRSNANLQRLGSPPYIDAGIGLSAGGTLLRRVAQALAARATVLAFSTDNPLEILTTVIFRRNRKTRYSRDIMRSVIICLWTISRTDVEETTIGDVKLVCRQVYQEVTQWTTITGEIGEGPISAIASQLLGMLLRLPSSRQIKLRRCAETLSMLQGQTLFRASPLSTDEGWRITRGWLRPAPILVQGIKKYISPNPAQSPRVQEAHRMVVQDFRIPDYQKRALKLTTPEQQQYVLINQNLLRPCGVMSATINEWINILPEADGPCLVIGTGAGAIQACLASLGIESRGIDLLDVMADQVRGKRKRRLGEAQMHPNVNCFPHRAWADTNFNVFDINLTASVIQSERYSSVIIDVELAEKNPLGALLKVVNNIPYSGTWFIKMTASDMMMGYIWGAILRGQGIRRRKLYSIIPDASTETPCWVLQLTTTGTPPSIPTTVDRMIQFNKPHILPLVLSTADMWQFYERLKYHFPLIPIDIEDLSGLSVLVTSLVSDRRGRGSGSSSWRAESARTIYVLLLLTWVIDNSPTSDQVLMRILENQESIRYDETDYLFNLDSSERSTYIRQRILPWLCSTLLSVR